MTLPKLHLRHSFGITIFTGVSWGTWWFGLYRINMTEVYIEAAIDKLRTDPEVRVYKHKEQETHHERRDDKSN